MSISEGEAGALRIILCTADWCGAPDAFGNCAAVFDATSSGTSFTGTMVDNTDGCCRGCPGQERGWENGCQITGTFSTGWTGYRT
jgi:hypothetical protein